MMVESRLVWDIMNANIVAAYGPWVRFSDYEALDRQLMDEQTRSYGLGEELASLQERERVLREALQQMLDAIDANGIDSQEIEGDYESGIPPHKWHEEWAHYARAALQEGTGK